MAAGGGVVEPRRRGFVWAGIAAAAVVGFLAGSTGLAMADALPDPAQAVAHDVLRVVQVDVPQGKEGKRGPCMAEAAKIKDKDAKKAAKDACPKGGSDKSGDESGDEREPGRRGAGDTGAGPARRRRSLPRPTAVGGTDVEGATRRRQGVGLPSELPQGRGRRRRRERGHRGRGHYDRVHDRHHEHDGAS